MLNFLGMVLPSLIALAAIPLCVQHYGDEQFGILSLAWAFIVSFAFFNLGLGIGATKYVAELIRDDRRDKVAGLVWSTTGINLVVGIFFSIVIFFTAPWITDQFIQPSAELRESTIDLFYYTGLSIPFITISLSLKGVLDASNRFDLANAIKVPSTSLLFIIPALGALFSLSISTVVLLLAISRALVMCAFFFFVVRLYPEILRKFLFDVEQVRSLIKFGGWVSISSILNPLIMQGEKFLIPAIISVGALTYYSAPHDMIARITVIAASLSSAMLPKLSYLGKEDTREMRESTISRPLKYLLFAMTPLAAFFIFFSQESVFFLLGGNDLSESRNTLIVLTGTYFFSSLSALPFSAVNGFGYPELKAKWDIVLAPAFLLLSYLLTSGYGIVGAAVSKFVALTADMACLYWMLKYLLRLSWEDFFSREIRVLGVVSVGFLSVGGTVSLLEQPVELRVFLYIVSATLFTLFAWNKSMDFAEREKLKSLVLFASSNSKASAAIREE